MADQERLQAPLVLVSMPQVLDPFFHKTVILLVHHDEEGSLGFILNRPTQIKVGEILGGMEIGWQGDPATVAFFGGPVQPQLGSIVFGSDEVATGPTNASALLPGLAISQHVHDLAELAAEPPETFRLFLGYAGWGEGQLLEEILRNDWLTAPVDLALLREEQNDETWERVLRSLGVDPTNLPSWTPGEGGGPAN
ncbi:MAG TPA: YqgE/AlgH family protein [Thermoanaerobaculia bacterium]|nr:YqgE/AlgH family protein [Thermoanaerobaculia bacterium]